MCGGVAGGISFVPGGGAMDLWFGGGETYSCCGCARGGRSHAQNARGEAEGMV